MKSKRIFVWGVCSISLIQCKSDPPNVILILTDDQGYGDLGIHGNPYLKTPVLDSLAHAGVRLDNYHVSPVSAPTRASLLTGRYHLRTGTSWVTRGLENMNPEEYTLAELFKDNGYATGCFGKWHNGSYYPLDPNGQGFDEFVGFCAGHCNNYFDPLLQHNDTVLPTKGFITDVLTDLSIGFIKENKERPFFCYIPFNAPHSPFQCPEEYFRKYKDLGLDDKNAAVYGMCENIDFNVGRILRSLEEQGLSENTLVIFTSDNGPNGQRYNAGMKGIKASVDEGGVRVPFFMRWKNHLPEGIILHDLTAHVDVFPTLVKLCRLKVKQGLSLDGKDLSDRICGKQKEPLPRQIFTHHNAGEQTLPDIGSVRNSQFLLTRHGEAYSLYDMAIDPGQTHDLSGKFPEITANLKADYEAWFREVSAQAGKWSMAWAGFRKNQRSLLPAQEAHLSGQGISFQGKMGWANDWIIKEAGEKDTAVWFLRTGRTGTYRVFLQYTCRQEQTGSIVHLACGNQEIQRSMDKVFIPRLKEEPDRVARTEVFEQSWDTLHLGNFQLEAGDYELRLYFSKVPPSGAGEFKSIIIR